MMIPFTNCSVFVKLRPISRSVSVADVGFPATDAISHVTCLLFAFECVPHMGRSQQIKYLRLYFNVLVFQA